MPKFNKITYVHIIYWSVLLFLSLGMMIWYSVITSNCNKINHITQKITVCKNFPQVIIWTSITGSIFMWVGIDIFVGFILRNKPIDIYEEVLSLKLCHGIRITNFGLFIFGLQLEEDLELEPTNHVTSDVTTNHVTSDVTTNHVTSANHVTSDVTTNHVTSDYIIPIATVVHIPTAINIT